MGISGLLPLLKNIQVNTHVRNYKDHVVGVDAYVWLHRGAFACAWDLALGKHTTKYVDYAMHQVKMLQHHGVIPYIVFDGGYLPSKAKTEKERHAKRQESRRAGMELLAQGKKRQAMDMFKKCVDITPEMAYQFILALRKENVDYVVAPYEADAQLAYLEKIGLISAIITEDSDLLVFGCKCVLLKMDQYGECIEIRRERFSAVTEVSLVGWTDQDFRHMAILSGCDYLASIPGMGLKTAHRLLRKYKTVERVLRAVRMEAGFKVPENYDTQFKIADKTFLHQWVYCPLAQRLVMWNEPDSPLTEETIAFIGRELDPETARAVSSGALNPNSLEPITLMEGDKENVKPHKWLTKWSTPSKSKLSPGNNKSITSFFSPKAQSAAAEKPGAPPHQENTSPTHGKRGHAIGAAKIFKQPEGRHIKRTKSDVQSEQQTAISPYFNTAAAPQTPPFQDITNMFGAVGEAVDTQQVEQVSITEKGKQHIEEPFSDDFLTPDELANLSGPTVETVHTKPSEIRKFTSVSSVKESVVVMPNIERSESTLEDNVKNVATGWRERYARSSPVTANAKPVSALARMGMSVLSRSNSRKPPFLLRRSSSSMTSVNVGAQSQSQSDSQSSSLFDGSSQISQISDTTVSTSSLEQYRYKG
ncbi:PIN domain-like protein [Saitoella complicata NRRL Y-17804]|uniref:Uncharacterized protein n=1 Tax=Saitoella complicata (strain BCRC 22490 / CBS 7301 / JCM 7358 / NBRC 10748 / NRRL Y-17804) TaxID=698492 RepID=A0A0E9NFK8_SAICN|nr:PIN domain-like protein [Saitoella complicata NRRL Y-17804]ODQ51444.1 PIN domain-like protein [Saitoella complicata NRRL Y-17804]GAO48195.1 hypothetical protein G7K_2375-t1 [Saitoella complicata NRRL Y-17804]